MTPSDVLVRSAGAGGAPAPATPAGARPAVPVLSRRETEVLRAWLFTDSKREAAAGLFLSEGTVNTYVSRVRAKYALAGRAAPTKVALLARALTDGIVRIEEF